MKCEHCGHDQPSGKFCDSCGRILTRIRHDEPDDAQEDQQAGQARVHKCHRCGHEQSGGRICEGCGMMLDAFQNLPEEEEISARCPECGTSSSVRICRNCGIPIPGFPSEEA
jgi:ribosomal protein L32